MFRSKSVRRSSTSSTKSVKSKPKEEKKKEFKYERKKKPSDVLYGSTSHTYATLQTLKKERKDFKKMRRVDLHKAHPLHRLIKSSDTTDDSYLSALETMSSMLDPGTVYSIRLAHYANQTTDVAGKLAVFIQNDPSTWQEWSSLTALFSQVRIRRSQLHVVRTYNPAVGTTVSTGQWQPLILNALYDDVGASTTYDTTCDAPNFKVYDFNFDTGKSGISITLNYTGVHQPLWADTGTAFSSTVYAGCPGGFQLYMDGGTASTVVVATIQVLDLEFMNRM